MEEKIAIQCNTEDEWSAVSVKSKANFAGVFSMESARDCCHGDGIPCISSKGGWNPRSRYIEDGYTIISAKEYLNEKGGEDVSKLLKKGDKVRITGIQDGHDARGKILTLVYNQESPASGITVMREDGGNWYYSPSNYELITGEDTMSISINKTIRKVFQGETFELVEKMQHYFGNEIQENFSGEIFLTANKKKFEAEIIRRDKEAEEKKKAESCKSSK